MYSDDSAASEVESDVDEVYGNGGSDGGSDVGSDGGSERVSKIADSDDLFNKGTMLKQQRNENGKFAASNSFEYVENDYSGDSFDDDVEEYKEVCSYQPSVTQPTLVPKAPSSPARPGNSDSRRFAISSTEPLGDKYVHGRASIETDDQNSQNHRLCRAQPFKSNELTGTHAVLALVAKEGAEGITTLRSELFSQLSRMPESKFVDEIDELRKKNTLLLQNERELKAMLRQAKEDVVVRKARMKKKRRRATERRREHEKAKERVQQELATALLSNVEHDRRIEGLQRRLNEMQVLYANVDQQKERAEERTIFLAEKLQTALGDLHQLTSSFENAVNAKLACEQHLEQLKAMHRIKLEVIKHKCKIDTETARQALVEEAEARRIERQTLPEFHQRAVEAEKERFHRLEAIFNKQINELESRAAQDILIHTAELARANEAKHLAEQRAERRIHDEVDRIAREREAVDEQRRELLASLVRTNARFDEERGKMEARSCELDARQSKLADECAELKSRTKYIEQRSRHLEESEVLVERRRTELAAVGRETLERSYALARRGQEFADAIAERDKLRCAVKDLTARLEQSELRAMTLEQNREKLETAAYALEQERLIVAQQRVQSRYLLDSARKLESMYQHKHVAVGGMGKRCLVPSKANFNQQEHYR
ncbi:hypothetical protein Plhal304r1_c068g0156471 [Plasmopara halstedii]